MKQKYIRRIPQINKKIENSRPSILFKNACLKNNIQSKYTNLKII